MAVRSARSVGRQEQGRAADCIVHLTDGWQLNWFGAKKEEGIEYFVMLMSLLLITVLGA
jgi:hypothetical protein